MPLDFITAAAAGLVRRSISALAPDGFWHVDPMPTANTIRLLRSPGKGPTTCVPGTAAISEACADRDIRSPDTDDAALGHFALGRKPVEDRARQHDHVGRLAAVDALLQFCDRAVDDGQMIAVAFEAGLEFVERGRERDRAHDLEFGGARA
jgi:hypothetical protein